jgi:hypothetical protein
MGPEGRPPPQDGWLSPRHVRRPKRPEASGPTTPLARVEPDRVSGTFAALRAASAAFARVEASGEQVRRTLERIAIEKHAEPTEEHELVDDDEYENEYAYDDDDEPATLVGPPLGLRGTELERVRSARSRRRQKKRRRRLVLASLVAALGLGCAVVARQALG